MNDELDVLQDTYEILEKIGTGGGGDVYKAYHKRLRVEVVIKKIHDNIAGRVNARTEADILKNLKSPYLPKVFDYIEANGSVFTVMEFIPGISLQRLLDKGEKFSQKRVIKWSVQLAEAVSYLHSQNPPIIHSDIKPDNIMLTPQDDICLIDFNVSLSTKNGKAAVIGITNGYSPPEQYPKKLVPAAKSEEVLEDEETEFIEEDSELPEEDTVLMRDEDTVMLEDEKMDVENEKKADKEPYPDNAVIIDARADIYSMGATIYHLLVGKRPEASLKSVTPISTYEEMISDGMIYIVSKAMEKSPRHRFWSAEDMRRALLGINKLDGRYKSFQRKRIFVYSFLVILLSVSVINIKFGLDELEMEKGNKYDELVYEAGKYIEDEEYDRAEELYNEAIDLYEDRTEAYYLKALALYKIREYEECSDFILKDVINGHNFPKNNEIAEIYYILGNCYFELEDYESSGRYLDKAIEINNSVPKYYRDYAVSLARCGEMENAEMIIDMGVSRGIGEADLYYVNSELCYLKQEYSKAIENAKSSIAISDDEYLIMRAYIIQSKSYTELSKTDSSFVEANISVLKEAVSNLPQIYTVGLLNMLAQIYIDNERNTDAIETIDTLIELGWETYLMYYNKALLYQKEKDFETANHIYDEIMDMYGENYEIYKRKSFLEAERQMSLENKNRDYKLFAEYYNMAFEIYSDVDLKQPDEEMQTLKFLYEDIKAGGWLEE